MIQEEILFHCKNDGSVFSASPFSPHQFSFVSHAPQNTGITWSLTNFFDELPISYINRFHFRGGKVASSEVSCSQQRPCHNRHDQLIHFAKSKLSNPKVPSYLEYSKRSTSITVTKMLTYVFNSFGYLIFMKAQTEHLNKNNLNITLISTFIPWNATESLKTQWLCELLLFYLQPGIIIESSSNRSTSKILYIKFFSRRIQNIATKIYQRIRSRITLSY